MRLATVRSPNVLLLVLTAAAAAEPNTLVGYLKDPLAIRGCAWSAWIPSRSPSSAGVGEGLIFLADRDDSRAVMNIGGKDVTLAVEGAFSRLPVRGELLRRTYRAPGIEVLAEYTTTDDCSKSNNEACELSTYSVRFEVQQGGQTQVVSAMGTVGC
jgi:hypothetical protein